MTLEEKLNFLRAKAYRNLNIQIERGAQSPVVEWQNGKEKSRRPKTEQEIEQMKQLYQQNYDEYIQLLNDTPKLIEDSMKYIPLDKLGKWVDILMRGLEDYHFLYGSPSEEYDIRGFLSAGKILSTIKEKGATEASKLMTANTNSDVWDYDTLLIIEFGGQAGKDCFRQSERFKHKMETETEKYKQQILDHLNDNADYITRN